MKKLIVLFVLLGFLVSCKSNSSLKKIDFLFLPSFLPKSKFTIDVKNSTIYQYTFRNHYALKKVIDSNTYRSHFKDTVIVYYQKTFTIDTKHLTEFLKEIKVAQLTTTKAHNEPIFDGIDFTVNKISSKNDTISLTSNLTRRDENSKLEYKLLDAFFRLSHKSITDYTGISIVENIQNYFSYGLSIKKVNEQPLEYRVWGTIYGCREDNEDFISFLKDLPTNKPIIFDIRNGSFAYCLTEVLEEYSEKNEIYFYGDKNMVSSKKIIDEMEILEKKGERLSKLRTSTYKRHKIIYDRLRNNKKVRFFLTRKDLINTLKKKAHLN